jgi:hypothetical protein
VGNVLLVMGRSVATTAIPKLDLMKGTRKTAGSRPQSGRGEVRIVVTILTNENETNFAIDFYRAWPFFTFEFLDSEDPV